MAGPAAARTPSVVPALSGPGRHEAMISLGRAAVLLFSAAALFYSETDATPFVLAHLGAAGLSALATVPLLRLRTATAARRAAALSTAVDVLALATYAVVADGRSGLGTLFAVYLCILGPLRWGLRGLLATALPVGVISAVWPLPDASGDYASGAQLWLLLLALTLPAAGIGALWRRSGARLRQAHEQFQAAFEHASIGMALLDEQRRVLQVNPALAELLGMSVVDLTGTDLAARAEEVDREVLRDALARLAGSQQGIRAEVRFRRPDGQQRWGLVAASWLAGSSGVPPRVIAQVENVTDRKHAEERLSHLAEHDTLTGLPNRALLLAHLDDALHSDSGACLVFLDLDRFKVVNDGLGHAAGDRLLQEVADRLRSVLRPGDVAARIGGDEFVVLCHAVRRDDEALAVAERVLSALRGPVQLDERSQSVASASAGVAVARAGATSDTLLRDADSAMYAAKAAGGSRVRVFTPELHEAAQRTNELEIDLRRALVEERLHVSYQPIVDVLTGSVAELEALVRWTDDDRGAVAPEEFVAVAEQSSLIEDLGLWVLGRALRDASRWPAGHRDRAPGVSVNVSPRQLLDRTFPDVVVGLLDEHGVEAGRLCLEVTETALVDDAREMVPVLQALRGIGVRLAIDDFGTGHASLTYLSQLPVDGVKVDRTFVSGVAAEAGSAAIVGGVVAMAGAFGLTVVAEGVETTDQLQRLRLLGVDRVQGYLLARPMTDSTVHDVLIAAPPVPTPRAEDAAPTPVLDVPQRFRVLLEAAREITGCVDLGDVLRASFVKLRTLIDFTGGSIQLVDGDVVRLAATDPPATPEAMAATMPVGTGVSGGVVATGEPRYLPDITIAAAVTPESRSRSSSHGVRSWYGVPLVAEGRTIGVLQVDSTSVDAFTESDRLLVLSFASVVASAVQSSRLFAQELNALQQPPG